MELRSLIDIMNEQLAVYSELLTLEKEKAGVLGAGDVDALDGIINKELSLSMKAHNLEQKRIDIVAALGYEEQTVSQIIAAVAGAEASDLGTSFDLLLEVLNALKHQNEINMKVLESRLGVIDFLLSETPLGGAAPKLYTSDAKPQQRDDASGNLSRKA